MVDRLLGHTGAWLIPENGYFLRRGAADQPWEQLADPSTRLDWKDDVCQVLDYFVSRTPRSCATRRLIITRLTHVQLVC